MEGIRHQKHTNKSYVLSPPLSLRTRFFFIQCIIHPSEVFVILILYL